MLPSYDLGQDFINKISFEKFNYFNFDMYTTKRLIEGGLNLDYWKGLKKKQFEYLGFDYCNVQTIHLLDLANGT